MSAETRVVDLSRYWRRIVRRRAFIAKLSGAATVMGVVAALLLPPWYKASVSLLPPTEEESGFGLSSLLKGIGVPGVKVPSQAQPADVFMAEIQSRTVSEEIVRRFGLQKLYKRKLMEDAVKELHHHAIPTVTEVGMIVITVEDHDPKRAADMANAYAEILDRFNRTMRMTKGRRTREFVEQRLNETRNELHAAEQRLADYLERRKTLALTPEMSTSVEAAARLYGERTALEVRLGVAENYSRGSSDEIRQIQDHIDQIDRQLSTLPATGLESARLLRDVKTSEALYLLLTSQYEEARIDEVRDLATVEVLDAAEVPQHKSRPRRSILVLVTLALSLGAGVAVALLDPREPTTA